MGPMTAGRAVSLAALVAVLFGTAIGLSHIGHPDVVGVCNGATWKVVIGHAADPQDVPPINMHAGALVPTSCYAAQTNPAGGYDAIAEFSTQADAQAFMAQLVARGWTRTWHVTPVLEHH